ncbi:MAG: glycoside hydrolase family 5 protein, partial [Dehalococcoidia bacterium]|nr:glycoside hydrolase family 5 protein [Dehalococcoidia bacterium]
MATLVAVSAPPAPPVSADGPAASSVSPFGIGYGVLTIAAPDRLDRAKAMGFNWVKTLVAWRNVQPNDKRQFIWGPTDGDVERAHSRGIRLLLRVDQPPRWATGSDAHNAPPVNEADLADFMAALAARYRGRVAAYEIWNEPNLRDEWGGQRPDPAKYARMLCALYPRVKAADPGAIVVTGGLSTTGDAGANDAAWGDLTYLQALYDHGARGCFDAVGSHPYAGPSAPDVPTAAAPLGLSFRRAEEQRAVVERNGDNAAIWATEIGWLHNQNPAQCNLATYDPYRAQWQVSEAQQAQFLAQAFAFAQRNWPWSGPLFIFNQDFSVDTWRVVCDPFRFFALVRGNGAPLQAFTTLRDMPRWETDPPSVTIASLPPAQGSLTFWVRWTGADA